MSNQKTFLDSFYFLRPEKSLCPYNAPIKSFKLMLQSFHATVQKFGVDKIFSCFSKKTLILLNIIILNNFSIF